MGGDAPGGIVASILTQCTYRKGEVEMIVASLRTVECLHAIKSLLTNFHSRNFDIYINCNNHLIGL
jgi:hypothetical protein